MCFQKKQQIAESFRASHRCIKLVLTSPPPSLPADGLCPPGQLYLNCSEGGDGLLPGRGVACERTCESYLLNLTCSAHEPCVAGCSCPPG